MLRVLTAIGQVSRRVVEVSLSAEMGKGKQGTDDVRTHLPRTQADPGTGRVSAAGHSRHITDSRHRTNSAGYTTLIISGPDLVTLLRLPALYRPLLNSAMNGSAAVHGCIRHSNTSMPSVMRKRNAPSVSPDMTSYIPPPPAMQAAGPCFEERSTHTSPRG